MRKRRHQTNTVYEHIWRAIAMVVALVFVVGGIAITVYVDKSVTEQINARERAYLSGVDAFLSHQMASAQQMLNMLLTNPFIVQSIHSNNSIWSSAVYQSGQTVVNAVNSNQLYNSIYVISGDEIAIKSSRRYQTQETEERIIRAMRLDFRNQLLPWKLEFGSRLSYNLMLLSALDAVSTPNETGGVLINLDLGRLSDMAFVNHGQSDVYMVVGEQVVASTKASAFFTLVNDNALLYKAINKGSEQVDGFFVYSLTNSTYGYTLYAVQSHAELMMPARARLTVVMLSLCVLLTATLLLSRRVALHAYTPVKTILVQLEEQLPKGGDMPADGLSELQRVSRSIKRTSEIVSAYHRDADSARLGKFIRSGVADAYVCDIFQKHLDYDGNQHLYMLLLQAEELDDAHMLMATLQGYLDGYARFLTLDIMEGRLLSLICFNRQDNGMLNQSIEQLLQLSKKQESSKVIMTLYHVPEGDAAIHEAYMQMDERMRSSIFCAGSTLLMPPTSVKLSHELAQQLYNTAQTVNHTEYMQTVAACLEVCSLMPAREAYHRLATLCMRLSEAGSSRAVDLTDKLDTYRVIQNTLFTLRNYDALMAYMRSLHQSVLERLDERKAGENNLLVEHMMSYINAHFADASLSAAQVADSLGISTFHLSRVMNKYVGCGFPELLLKRRLDYAVQLLMENQGLSILAVAQQSGFASASYFTASFKRIYGTTPSHYRLQHLSKEAGNET